MDCTRLCGWLGRVATGRHEGEDRASRRGAGPMRRTASRVLLVSIVLSKDCYCEDQCLRDAGSMIIFEVRWRAHMH
jgi:hypothetical protein